MVATSLAYARTRPTIILVFCRGFDQHVTGYRWRREPRLSPVYANCNITSQA